MGHDRVTLRTALRSTAPDPPIRATSAHHDHSGGSVTRTRAAAAVGLLVAGAVEVVLAHRTAAPGGILVRRYALLAEIGLWWLAYAGALLCVRALPRRAAVLAVLGLAVVLRLAAVSDKAPLSDDLYRYAWDGVVQSAGIDPYRYPPDAPELAQLRESWLWPPELAGQERQTQINRAGVPTIYPPVAQAWFWLEHQAVPLSARDRGYEAAGLVLDLAVLVALLALLRSAGGDPRAVAVYALAPLPVLEAVQNAHVDVLAVLFVLAAVGLAARRPVASAAALTCAALVKVYPGLLLPLLLRRRGTRVRVAATCVAVAGLAYLPHVLAVGVGVLGYLPGYLQEERYDEGTRYLLVGLLGLRGPVATGVVAVALAGLLAWVLRRDLPLPEAGVCLLLGVFLLLTPVQPWYSLVLLALAVLAGAWRAVPVAAAGYPLFFATILGGPGVAAGRLSYGLAALGLVVAALYRRRARGTRELSAAPGSA